MTRFITKALALSFIVLFICTIVLARYKPKVDIENDCMASIIDKHDRLKHAGPKRLLLVGGSNVSFGFKSEMLERELGFDVVNLGLNAGLGGVFILNEATSAVGPGDTVVVSLEYSLYRGNCDVDLIRHTQKLFPEAEAYYRFGIKNWLLQEMRRLQRSFKSDNAPLRDEVYCRKAFNVYGDLINRVEAPKGGFLITYAKLKTLTVDDSIVQAFDRLAKKCKVQGAKVYLCFPVYPQRYYPNDKDVIDSLEAQIKDKLAFIPRIGGVETFILDDSCFYDTVYHLNHAGRELRTAILIEELRATLQHDASSSNAR